MELLPELGEIIVQRYRLLDILGTGGSGTTYLAEDLQSSQRVALKTLSLHQIDDWKMIELFEREAHVLAQLNHPAIPRYLEYFHVDTPENRSFYIAQQIAEGQSLAALVQNGWHTSEGELRSLAIQILEILVYLHGLTPPIIHRDIKPQNIIRRADGQVWLVDFGAVQNTYYSTFARNRTVVGTFGYMAPEQFLGRAVPVTDLYGLGATLLFLLTHRSPADLPTDHLKINFRSACLPISEGFADWLETMLEPDVADRFPSAKVALSELHNRRVIPVKSSLPARRQGLVKLGIAAIAAITIVHGFKYPFLSFLGLTPSALYSAAEQGDLATVRNYLEQGVATDARDGEGTTPLHWAGSLEVAKLLIAKGADVNARDRHGWTPLHYARSLEVAQLLIAQGADVNAKSKLNLNQQSISGISLESQLNISKFRQGVTPLHYARSRQIAELLITNGADINAKTKDGITPLHWVRSKEVADLLIAKGAQIDAEEVKKKNYQGATLLHKAAKLGSKPMVALLLVKGANIMTRDNFGRTPLHFARSKDVAELLIADVNARDSQGNTPLHEAAKNNRKEVVELLLAQAANINAKNTDGLTSLHEAAYQGNADLVKLLLAMGAQVNAKDKLNQTPLRLTVCSQLSGFNRSGLNAVTSILKSHGGQE